MSSSVDRGSDGVDVALVTIMLAQNETGAILPVGETAAHAHRVGAVVHSDAAQAIGKIDINVDDLDVDLLAMGVTRVTALGAVRLSLGRDTTATDISQAALILTAAHALATTEPAR